MQAHIDSHPGVSLVFGVRRPAPLDRRVDYRIVVASETPLSPSFADQIIRIVHEEMNDDTLRVEVIALPSNWADTERRKTSS